MEIKLYHQNGFSRCFGEIKDKHQSTARWGRKEYRKKYASQPKAKEYRKKYQEENKEKISEQRWRATQKKNLLNKNTHDICRLVGIPFTNNSRYKIRCTYCSVAYTDKDLKENYFVKKYRCPCCKRTLKTFRRKHDKPRM